MHKADLPKHGSYVENRVTGRVGSVADDVTWRQQNELCGYNGKPACNEVILKDRDTGELYLDKLAELVYEPYLESPEISWGAHSVSYFGDINLELWIAFPEGSKWYNKVLDFIAWLEGKYDRDADGNRIFGSRAGASRIYYCTVYIERLPEGYDAFKHDVEQKIAELVKGF